jgi:hypothetical protein
MPGKT